MKKTFEVWEKEQDHVELKTDYDQHDKDFDDYEDFLKVRYLDYQAFGV